MFDFESESAEHALLAGQGDLHPAARAFATGDAPRRPAPPHAHRVASTDPAALIMTDFAAQTPVLVTAERLIDDALRDMMVAGVRALLVARGEKVIGLITSYDIQGERPLQFLNSSSFTRHDEIQVGHVMTPWEQVPMLDWNTVRTASVADIAARFRAHRAITHIVVLERAAQGGTVVRGLFSRTRLERQLDE
ncbi:MAG: CBS domain-containing protein [Steroidobacteraceae bacterium]